MITTDTNMNIDLAIAYKDKSITHDDLMKPFPAYFFT